jgi:hypothetical protein
VPTGEQVVEGDHVVAVVELDVDGDRVGAEVVGGDDGRAEGTTRLRPSASSWVSRRRRISRSNQLRSESGSRRWSATFTRDGPQIPSTIAAGKVDGSATEKPAPGSSLHCIGVRTLERPSTARFSPIPISSP